MTTLLLPPPQPDAKLMWPLWDVDFCGDECVALWMLKRMNDE
jgi:hypothetical protein